VPPPNESECALLVYHFSKKYKLSNQVIFQLIERINNINLALKYESFGMNSNLNQQQQLSGADIENYCRELAMDKLSKLVDSEHG
jgi:SpoVK/Ycf46/Vps4 family AAA+-type ATPase